MIGVGLAFVVGLSLGLFGGGGGVLSVPILVYVLHVAPKSAVPMSLLVVGSASAVGALQRWRAGRLHPRRALGFAALAMLGAALGARVSVFVSARMQLIVFSVAVLFSAYTMLRSAHLPERARHVPRAARIAIPAGIGALTSIIGIGGGIFFVPALVAIYGMPMAEASAVSLLVIAVNAVGGLLGYQGHVDIAWNLALPFAGAVIAGLLAGTAVAPRVPVPYLKRGFAVLILAVGILVLVENAL